VRSALLARPPAGSPAACPARPRSNYERVSTGSDASSSTSSSDSGLDAGPFLEWDGYCEPHLGCHYSLYNTETYVGRELPSALRAAIASWRDKVLVVARPTMDVSAGLAHYREVTTKQQRKAALAVVVVDQPGQQPPQDDKYHWCAPHPLSPADLLPNAASAVPAPLAPPCSRAAADPPHAAPAARVEVPLIEVFKLDVSGMASWEDYMAHIGLNQRKQYKARNNKLAKAPGLRMESGPMPRDAALVEELWGLYEQQGTKNGCVVTSHEHFVRIHMTLPGLQLVAVRDDNANGKVRARLRPPRAALRPPSARATPAAAWCLLPCAALPRAPTTLHAR
jgi:hypothetical protein